MVGEKLQDISYGECHFSLLRMTFGLSPVLTMSLQLLLPPLARMTYLVLTP